MDFLSWSSENEEENNGILEEDDDFDYMSDTDEKLILKLHKKKNFKKKEEIVSLILRFKTRIIAIEKEKKSQLYSKNSCHQSFACLEEEENKMNYERKNEKNQLKESIKKISIKVETLKNEKLSQKKSTAFIEKLRLCIEDIESNIMQLKEKQSKIYEELNLKEQKLTDIVNGYEKKFEQWSNKVFKVPKVNINNNKDEFKLPEEVKDFEDYIMLTGGHQGGWDDIDHNIFLKLRKQFKNNEELIKKAEEEIATQSREDIIQHIQWFHEYSKLKERKRKAICMWKIMKQHNRESALAKNDDEPTEEEKKRVQREMLFKKEREKRFAVLEQWKKEKGNQKLEEEHNKKEVPLNDKEEQRKIQLKLQVEEYKKHKAALKLANEKKVHRKVLSLEQKEKILERNEKLISFKREKQLARKYELEEKEKRLEKLKEKVAVNVSRDPARLYELTEVLKCRRESDSQNKVSSAIPDVRLLPKKAVPLWRKTSN
ncbi:coiled-coil domain-containing protein 112 isoform X1 [Hydra vulgaris]|uniref:coiled-coil domain-containing protein 112 isoform X1 n=1 Tax=Hydra vulgaris TaxID=6087 RepID=UPI001F5EB93A|nr:coiled-coil domain-containing protein 112 [Hydra vulgaris]